jgi:hypothetical protein
VAQGTFDQPTPDFGAIYNTSATAAPAAGGDFASELAALGLDPSMLQGATDAELQALAQMMLARRNKVAQAVSQSPLGSWLQQQGITVAQPQVDAQGNPVQADLLTQLSALNVPGGGERTPENQAKANDLAVQMQDAGATGGWGGGKQQAGQPKGFAPNGRSLAYFGQNVAPFTDVYTDPTTGLTADMQRTIESGAQQADGFGRTAPAGAQPSPSGAPANARAAAIPTLQGYISNLQAVSNPTKTQAQQLAQYQARLTAYQTPAAPVVQAAPSGGAEKPAPTATATTAAPKVTQPVSGIDRTAAAATYKSPTGAKVDASQAATDSLRLKLLGHV